jgi:hypothetical protein
MGEIVYTIVAGPAAGGTAFINSNSGGDVFSGKSAATLVIEEVKG